MAGSGVAIPHEIWYNGSAGMQDSLSKTLIIRFSSVGDIILSSPLVRALHRTFPEMQLDFLVKDDYADLVRYNPHLHQIVPFASNGGLSGLLELRRMIQSQRYDLILDIHDSLRSRVVCFGLSRVRRINKRKFARFALVAWKRRWYASLGGAPDVAARYIETASEFGVRDDGEPPEIFIPDASISRAQQMLEGVNRPALGICPSARHATKMWPEERFASAGLAIARTHHLPILLFGAREDHLRCESIRTRITKNDPSIDVRNLAGSTSLLDTAAMMDRCALVLTNDTGLMHLAVARHRPVIAIFGSTVREFGFFPRGTQSVVIERQDLACRPCSHIGLSACPRGHFKCMNDIAPDAVIHAANQLMQSHA